MIEIKNLSKSFDNNIIINDVTISVPNDHVLVLLGASGSGKSILIKMILKIMPHDKGSIKIYNDPEKNIKKNLYNNKKIGVLFQYSALFDSMNIQDNITFQLRNDNASLKYDYCRDLAKNLLQKVGIDPLLYLDAFPSQLSGGMKKRVALARAIANKPNFLFCDEPTSGLDPVNAEKIAKLIRLAYKDNQACGITITHDLKSALEIADSLAMLHDGKIILHCNKEEFLTSENPIVKNFIKSARVDAVADAILEEK